MSVTRRALCLPLLLAALATPALATKATPASGTTFELTLGQTAKVKLANANGCTFDVLAQAAQAGIVSLTPESGSGLKGATIAITAIGVGSTMVSIESMNGTCPPATHTYDVTVSADYGSLLKDFDKLAKTTFKDYRKQTKLAFKEFGSLTLGLRAEYKAGDLDDDELQDGFHDAAVGLRQAFHGAGTWAFMDVIGGGTALLDAADAGLGEAPAGFFAGGCGSFDWFQDSVCSSQAAFHDTYDKASKKAIKQFMKVGAPTYGQWNTLLPLVASGPFYPDQAPVQTPPMPLAAPLTITTRPASASDASDGRLLASGSAYGMSGVPFQVSLTWEQVDEPPVTVTEEPKITDDEWRVAFENLRAGAYTLSTRYADDEAAVEAQVAINVRF